MFNVWDIVAFVVLIVVVCFVVRWALFVAERRKVESRRQIWWESLDDKIKKDK